MTTTLEHTCITITPAELEDLLDTSSPAILDSPAGPLPLVAVSAETTIDGLIATTKYTQRFLNPTTDHLEVSYIFPLPSRAGVTDFVATLGSRRIEGILKERGAARAEYAEAVAESKRAAILEAERPDVFTAKIGNIAPNEEAVIELIVTGPLVVEDSEATFRFPLVTAPRYISGTPIDEDPAGTGTTPDTDAVPDASRLNPPLLSDNQPRPKLSFSVAITYPGLKVASLRTSHPMVITEGTTKPRVTTLTLEEGQPLNVDLLVRFGLPKELTINAVVTDDPKKKTNKGNASKEKEGTFAITVVAPRQETSIPRDVVVVFDHSGSMSGWKMVAAKRATARLVDSLLPDDNFALVAFDDRMDVFSPGDASSTELAFTPGTDRNRFAAISWIATKQARGGTEMRRPLTAAVDLLSGTAKNREPVVVLITDGQIGAEAQLLNALDPKIGRTRFCVVGIDRVPNTSLLERLGRRTNGYVTFVESEDRLDEALRNLHRRVGRPDLLSVKVTAEGAELIDEDLSPSRPVDVFEGVPCVVTGRYRRTGAKLPVFTLEAERASGGVFSQVVTATKSTAKGITDTWARARIGDLEDRYDSGGNTGDLSAKIIAVSIANRVLSRFTAFIAVDHETQEIASNADITQPVEFPGGWDMQGTSFVGVAMSHGGGLLRSFSSVAMSNTAGGMDASFAGTPLPGDAWETKSLVGSASPAYARVTGISRTRTRRPFTLTTMFLEECLTRLRTGTETNPAPVEYLIRRIGRLHNLDPNVALVLITLQSYATQQASLADTITAIEGVLQSVRAQAGSATTAHGVSPNTGQGYAGSRVFGTTDRSREFWA